MAAVRTSASDTYCPELMAPGKKNRHFGSPGESSTPPAGRQEPTEPWSNYPEILGGENARKKSEVGFVGGGWGGGKARVEEKKKSKIHEDGEKSDGGNGICAI